MQLISHKSMSPIQRRERAQLGFTIPRNSKTANYSAQNATKCLSVLGSMQYQLSVPIDEAFDRSIGIQNRNREIDRGVRNCLISGLQCEYFKILEKQTYYFMPY